MACFAFAATSACSAGDGGPGTPQCSRTLLTAHATSGSIQWTETGHSPVTSKVGTASDECDAELLSTLHEADGSVDTTLTVTCAALQISFGSMVPDVRSLHGNGGTSASLVAPGVTRTCTESSTVTWSVATDAGDAAPMPTMVTADYRRDLAFVSKTTIDDGCVAATWTMNVVFSLEATSFRYGAEACLVPG